MSSPWGGSIGFAVFTEKISQLLAKVDCDAAEANVQEILRTSGNCHFCQLLESAQAAYIKQLGLFLGDENGRQLYEHSQGVCLRQLGRLLAVTSREIRRFLLAVASHRWLQQLGKTGDEVRLLSEIERIITAHGLVEFRGMLSMLLDRMESAAFEIGVFGRVSSGKSSLLNYILQTDVLPVGVTPVTSIPTRISHGPVAGAGIEFAEAQPQIIPLSELAEFATEQKNPGNKKHVTRIFVKLPSDRLREGVIFVDTPGLGSLAVAGAEETIAYLPRCDLGIVLIDASAGLTPDDVIVVQALYQAGASAMVLISKADLFSGADRERMIAYVKANLRSELRVGPPVHAVSIFGADAALCDRWFETELRPFLAEHHELAIISQKRKVGALREAVIGALERRLHAESEGVSIDNITPPNEASEALRSGDRILERAQGGAFFLTRKITKMQPAIIDVAAQKIAAALVESNDVDVASIFEETLTWM